MSKFQLILTGAFAFFIVIGLIVFATARSKNSADAPQIILWGTVDSGDMGPFLEEARLAFRKDVNVRYVEKAPNALEQELVEALARGEGPDMVLLPNDLILRQEDKFYPIPFKSYSERLFKDSFVEGAEIFLSGESVLAIPFSVDPIVMYWNRDLFSAAGVAKQPATWDEFFTLVPKMTMKDAAGNIAQSTIALGEMRNIAHAKDILASLAIQAGNPIVMRDESGRAFSTFGDDFGQPLSASEEALRFYTEFANPAKASYSWNRALPNSQSAFVSGRLGVYFGYASELASIREKNPNLNFDVAAFPQVTGSALKSTYGDFLGFAILKTSPNLSSAFIAAATLTGNQMISAWSMESGLPPVRRDLLSVDPGTAHETVFYQSALMARAWLDPDPLLTDRLFLDAVEGITSGRYRITEAVGNVSAGLIQLLSQ